MTAADKARIEEIRALKEKSTPVVAWYPRPTEGVIKGPWNRWFSSIGPEEEHRCSGTLARASAEDDINYAAAALTDVPYLLDLIERQERMIARARFALENIHNHCPDPMAGEATMALADLNQMERGE